MKRFRKGEKKMTENAIKYQSLQEEKRHNKEEEGRKRKEFVRDTVLGAIKTGTDAGTSITKVLNDPSWYNLDKQLVKDVALVSFNTPLGNPVRDSFQASRTFPGVMSIMTAPTIGDEDAANSAAKNIYAFVRFANSGSKNYEPNDIMAYLLTMGEIYSFHAFGRRLYSLLTSAKSENKYYYDAMIKASHCDPVTFRENISQFRAWLNSFAIRVNALSVPKDLSLFQRRYWMYSNIFKDQAIKKSQEYIFVPIGWGRYVDTTSSIVFQHNYDNTSGTEIYTFAQFKAFGESLINAVLGSSDIGVMSGDILKAYGEGNLFRLPSTPEDYHVESVFSDEVLSQIHNATIVGEYDHQITSATFTINCPAGGTITQGLYGNANATSNGYIPIFIAGNTTSSNGKTLDYKILNFYKDNPTPDDVMVATRLTVLGTSALVGATLYQYNSSAPISSLTYDTKVMGTTNGSEVVVKCEIYYYDNAFHLQHADINHCTKATSFGMAYSNLTAGQWDEIRNKIIPLISLLNKFDWAPLYTIVDNTVSGGFATLDFRYDNLDAANTATVSQQTLKNMHYTAILSEYGVPKSGSKVRG